MYVDAVVDEGCDMGVNVDMGGHGGVDADADIGMGVYGDAYVDEGCACGCG